MALNCGKEGAAGGAGGGGGGVEIAVGGGGGAGTERETAILVGARRFTAGRGILLAFLGTGAFLLVDVLCLRAQGGADSIF